MAISVQGISGEGKPLVIIDGKEATGDDPLANISPDRIRSISVLKIRLHWLLMVIRERME